MVFFKNILAWLSLMIIMVFKKSYFRIHIILVYTLENIYLKIHTSMKMK